MKRREKILPKTNVTPSSSQTDVGGEVIVQENRDEEMVKQGMDEKKARIADTRYAPGLTLLLLFFPF